MRGHETTEIWLEPKNFVGRYEVSNLGRVRSLLSARGTKWKNGPLLMQVRKHTGGYLRISLCMRDHYIHRLVLETFKGESPFGFQCAHLDGNPENNQLGNLQWVTPLENQHHRFIHGTNLSMDRHPTAKLSVEKVLKIKELYKLGISQKEISKNFDVTQPCISLAINGKNWSAAK